MVVVIHELMGSLTTVLTVISRKGGLVAEDACLNPPVTPLRASDQEANCQKGRVKRKLYVKTSCRRCVIVDGNHHVDLLYA